LQVPAATTNRKKDKGKRPDKEDHAFSYLLPPTKKGTVITKIEKKKGKKGAGGAETTLDPLCQSFNQGA